MKVLQTILGGEELKYFRLLLNFIGFINPFIFINSLSKPWCVQTLFSLNCLKLTISEFLYNLLLVSYGDNEIKKKVKSYA
jgi:hypothetical protein